MPRTNDAGIRLIHCQRSVRPVDTDWCQLDLRELARELRFAPNLRAAAATARLAHAARECDAESATRAAELPVRTMARTATRGSGPRHQTRDARSVRDGSKRYEKSFAVGRTPAGEPKGAATTAATRGQCIGRARAESGLGFEREACGWRVDGSREKSGERQWSGRLDLNQRPLRPERSALPNCATPRLAAEYDAESPRSQAVRAGSRPARADPTRPGRETRL